MSTFQAVVVNTDGTAETVTWTPSSDMPTYRHLQKYVGGLIDVVALAPDMDMWVNDEGLILNLEPNLAATVLAAYLRRRAPLTPFVGPVVFTGGADDEGETRSLSDEAVELLHKSVRMMAEA